MGWHMLDMCLHPSAKNKMRKTRNLYSRQDDISKLRLCRIFMLTLAHLVSDITVRVMLALTSGQLNRLQINLKKEKRKKKALAFKFEKLKYCISL